MVRKASSRLRTWLLAGVAVALIAAPLVFASKTPVEVGKIDKSTQNQQAVEGYLRAIPQPGGGANESLLIRAHSAREWYLMTYPTGKMPSMPWDKAKKHIKEHVEDAPLWLGEGLKAPQGDGLAAITPPGTNAWVPYGPRPLDSVGTTNNAYQYGIVAGRVAVGGLAVDPGNTNVAYAAFAAGGLWKTTNLSAATPTWTPLWDDKDFVTQAASAIELDPTNSSVLYVGTGDWAARDQQSAGLMKSTDAGATWTHLGASVFTPYSPTHPAGGNRWDNQNVRTIQVDPNNPSKVLVGTRYDLYISHDAGATWQICGFGNGYTNPAVSGGTANAINRVSSLHIDGRTNPSRVYVAIGYASNNGNGGNGVYRFTMPASGCPAWPGGFTTLFGGFPANTGNGVNQNAGGSTTGRIELAAGTGTDGGLTLYAQVSNASTLGNDGTYVLRPDGGSTTWTKLTGSTSWTTCTGGAASTGQDWYDLFIAVDPANDKTLYIGHVDAFKSTVNATYTSVTNSNLTNVYSTSCASYGRVHPDQHAFAFVGTSGTTFLLGNDGGVYWNNASGATANWKPINSSFNTNQFYAGQISRDFAGGTVQQWVFGGMQDNGNSTWDSSSSTLQHVGRSVGGDGFFTTFDPLAGTLTSGWWLTEYTYGSVYCSRNSGADGPFNSNCGPTQSGTADWSAPLVLDTLHCTNTVCRNTLFGEDYVHLASAYSASKPTWRLVSGNLARAGSTGSIISASFTRSEPKAAVVGTSDGKLWWSENIYTGASCTQAVANTSSFSCTPNTSATWRDADSANAVLPNRAILGVTADPTNHRKIYAAVGGFNENTPATPGHVFELTWNGSAWTRVDKTGNLPNVPAASVAVNPHNRLQAFVGTYFGFYYTDNIDAASPTWVRYQWGLPNTVIRHLTVDRGPAANPTTGTTLAAFTYGRGVFAIRLPTGGGSFPAH